MTTNEALIMLKDRFSRLFDKKDKTLYQAISFAHADMSRRATGHKDGIKSACAAYLSARFEEMPHFDGQDAFNEWHKEICDGFIEVFDNAAMVEKTDIRGSFGRAQKVVNMTFKYLSCIDPSYGHAHQYCHMTLDGYTLDWYAGECMDWCNGQHKDDENFVPLQKKDLPEWSKIDNYGQYLSIQKNIRDYLKTEPCFSIGIDKLGSNESYTLPPIPFDAEFIVWEGMVAKAKYRYIIKSLEDYFCESGKKGSGLDYDRWLINDGFELYLKSLKG